MKQWLRNVLIGFLVVDFSLPVGLPQLTVMYRICTECRFNERFWEISAVYVEMHLVVKGSGKLGQMPYYLLSFGACWLDSEAL